MNDTKAIEPHLVGAVNWMGLWTLIRKEVERFFIVSAQTVVAPVISTLLYYVVFHLALGQTGRQVAGVDYMAFLTPGLVMMSMAQNAFANTSSSIVISKVQGNIVDVLMPPLSAGELATGYTVGGIVRGLAVGAFSVVVMMLFVHLPVHSLFFMVYHAVMGSMMMALLGLIGGIWSQKFDHLATVTNFVIMPATFLSGTFYTAAQLPEAWRFVVHANPFFYMIDGFRYGFIGVADSPLWFGVMFMAGVNLALWIAALLMLRAGYKLRA